MVGWHMLLIGYVHACINMYRDFSVLNAYMLKLGDNVIVIFSVG